MMVSAKKAAKNALVYWEDAITGTTTASSDKVCVWGGVGGGGCMM